MLNVTVLNAVKLNVIMLNVVMLNVVMLSVVAPLKKLSKLLFDFIFLLPSRKLQKLFWLKIEIFFSFFTLKLVC
jgi:hypothetical protein